MIKRENHKIDATDQSLGRLSTKIARLLIGKHKVTFVPNIDGGDFVEVENASKIKFTGNKFNQKKYYHHSGYPGGLKSKSLKHIFEKNSAEVLHKSVFNMLPKNKLRNEMIKRLKINN